MDARFVWGAVMALMMLAGVTFFIMETRGGTPLDDSIVIERPTTEVFKALIDVGKLDKLSQNIGQVQWKTQGLLSKGATYKRTLFSHGIPNPQVVRVEEFEANRLLVTQTTLVGFEVTYRYELVASAGWQTTLRLKKSGVGGWLVLQPLIVHLMTRPEHDGDHLMRIKRVVEAGS